MSEQQTFRRKKKIVEPKVQGNLILLTLFSAGVAVLVHASLSALLLSNLASRIPNDGREVMRAMPGLIVMGSLFALAVTLPLFALLGISATFRVFGPFYRFRVFLENTVAGKQTKPCRIRENDHYQDFCQLLNQATESVRAENASKVEAEPAEAREAA